MFTDFIEYETTLEKIVETNLSENQIDNLLQIITENSSLTPIELYDIVTNISNGEKIIMDGYKEYAFDPVLNEHKITNLIEIAIPAIRKHIPESIICHLTEKHARVIVENIMGVEFVIGDTKETLSDRIDEMFSAGNLSIPIQGLRPESTTIEIITNGVFAPMLHKGIQFGKEFHKKEKCNKNKLTIKDALKGYSMLDTKSPLELMLPKIIVTLKDLLGKKGK